MTILIIAQLHYILALKFHFCKLKKQINTFHD